MTLKIFMIWYFMMACNLHFAIIYIKKQTWFDGLGQPFEASMQFNNLQSECMW